MRFYLRLSLAAICACFLPLAACSKPSGSPGTASAEAADAVEPASGGTEPSVSGKAELGKPAPTFTLTDIDGKTHSLADHKGKTVVLEWFNPDCPFVRANHTEGSLKGMAGRHGDVVWMAINSGAPGKQGHGKDANTAGREKYGIDYPILLDETGIVGKAYGAETTPHMFVIDKEGILVYAGGIDNEPSADDADGVALVNYVENALGELKEGKSVTTQKADPYGCGVKY